MDKKDIEISQEDQKKINQFSKVNRRKNVNIQKIKAMEEQKAKLEDCLEELEMSMEDEVDYNFSLCFIKIPLDEATEIAEEELKNTKKTLNDLISAKMSQMKELDSLKADLYAKFGTSIQLEE